MNTKTCTQRPAEPTPIRPRSVFDALRMGLLSLIAPAVLVACGDPAPMLPKATAADGVAADVAMDRAVLSGSSNDPSVPAAASVVTPPTGDPQAVEGPALAPLTDEEESQAMPKDGQANDHSSPKMGS